MVEFLDDSLVIMMGFFGTLLSFFSLVSAAPTWKSRTLHLFYFVFIVVSIYIMSSYNARLETSLDVTQSELNAVLEIRSQASALFDSMYEGSDSMSVWSDPGRNRGNLLMTISFFETYSHRYPRSSEILFDLSKQVELSKVYSRTELLQRRNQEDALDQAADAARALIRGIAAGAQ